MDRPWLQQADALGTLLSRKGLVASATPLHQVPWKHEPLKVAFVAFDADLLAPQSTIHHVQKSVKLNQVHVIVIGSNSWDLHEGAAFFEEKLPWAWIEVQKVNCPLSGTGRVHFHAWHLHTTMSHTLQAPPPKSMVAVRCLLAPGMEPARLFLPARAPAELWVVLVPTNCVDDLLQSAGCTYDQVQFLQGPSGRSDTEWAFLPGLSEETKTTVQKDFYTAPYASFMPYGVYKGKLNSAHTVLEMWLQTGKRTPSTLSSVWMTMDHKSKQEADLFTAMPDIQWDSPCKLRIALWDAADTAAFIMKVVPSLLSSGYSVTDERTGVWIDEREVMSMQSGSFVYSVAPTASLQALGDQAEPFVLVDMPVCVCARIT